MPHYSQPLLDASFYRHLGLNMLDITGDVVKIIILYLLLRWGLKRIIGKVLPPLISRSELGDQRHTARLKTLAGLIDSISAYVLSFIFGIMLLRAFHLDPVPLLTTASVAGLAVGFGAQKLVKDVITGFFILLENQYAVGDYITIGTATGLVEDIGMRTTRVRDDFGKLYIISNGDITQVCNQSRGAIATFIEISLATAADLSKAREIINNAGEEIAKTRTDLQYTQTPAIIGISSMDSAKVTFRISCNTANPTKLTDAQIALRGMIHERLVDSEVPIA